MSEMPSHPMESAIVDALTQGLDALPESLPPTSEILAAAGDPTTPTPSPAAMAGVAEVVGGAETGAGHGWLFGLLSHRWTYVAAAVLVLVGTIGIVAAIQLHQGASGSSGSSRRPPAAAPSGGGSQAVGGVPSSTPLPTSTPAGTPAPMADATPPPETPAPTPTAQPATPAPTPPPTAAPAAAPPPPPPAPVRPSTPTPAPATAAPSASPPTATPTPCRFWLLNVCV